MITSISRNLAQQIVDNIHAVCGYHVNFINTNGMIYASSDPDRLNTYHDIGRESARTGETIEVESDEQFPGTHKGINIPVFHHMRVIAVVGISGEPSEVRRFAKLAERIASLLLHEQELNAVHRTLDEKKQYMIRSLIYSEFENMDYLRECFREFNIVWEQTYRMVQIEVNSRYNPVNISLLEQQVEALFSSMRNGIYVYNYPKLFIGLVEAEEFDKKEYMFIRFAEGHGEIVKTAIGKAVEVYKCNESYQSAEHALKTIKDKELYYVNFDTLTLEILFSGISKQQFREFSDKVLSTLSREDRKFLEIYYEKEMSLAATAEELFLHKNTVQQRLNRISQSSGLNPRKFREAVLFYLALRDQG
ncbi:CdaR family transcriptional regulator [Butyrivibrio sp. AC2005]|uniref:CdaR family transcriptional regulator n=1 Tax=Butyrivibrio sp. AC2005 TaxID=1280672 RepID=UPI0003FB6CE3|nr:sugar diacid recognition domain-containing protein [Butyrivibrio sp. AC2005]